MARKAKNKKPAVEGKIVDVSESNKESLSIPLVEQGRVPEEGVLPDEYGADDEVVVEDDTKPADGPDDSDKLTLGNSLKDAIWPSLPGGGSVDTDKTPDEELSMRGQNAVDAGKETDAVIGIQSKLGGPYSANEVVGKIRELVPGAMEVSEDPVAKFNESIVAQPPEVGSYKTPPVNVCPQVSNNGITDGHHPLPNIDTRVIGGTFKTDNLKAILPDDHGLQVGKLYIFAFNGEVQHLPEISAWLDNNIDWVEADKVDFYYFNQSSERAHVRHYRERATKERRIAIGILSVPPHCLMMEPLHIPHSQEADGVFVFTGTKLVRDKYRGIMVSEFPAREVTI